MKKVERIFRGIAIAALLLVSVGTGVGPTNGYRVSIRCPQNSPSFNSRRMNGKTDIIALPEAMERKI